MTAAQDVIVLTDLDDPRVHEYTGLTDVALRLRREPAEGIFIAESNKVIRRALAAGYRPRSFLMGAKALADHGDLLNSPMCQDVPVYTADAELLQKLTGFHLHRGALAAIKRPALRDPADVLAGARRVAVLEDIVDHTNVGAIIRCAAGLGVDAVLVTPRCADPLYRRSVRVSMGTVFNVPWTRLDPWPDGVELLRDKGFTLAAMALSDDAISLDELAADLPERLAILLGTEGGGLSAPSMHLADVVVRIPMTGGVDSLNVAAAAAVAFWATR